MTICKPGLKLLPPKLGGLIAITLAPGIEISLGKISLTISFWCLRSSHGVRVAKRKAVFTAPGFPENPGATTANTFSISFFSL